MHMINNNFHKSCLQDSDKQFQMLKLVTGCITNVKAVPLAFKFKLGTEENVNNLNPVRKLTVDFQ